MVLLKYLLIAHGACWMDVWDKEAGGYEYKNAKEECGKVEQQYQRYVELHGGRVDVIAGRIESYQAGVLLQEYDAQSN